jgi:hypothetical protein
MRKPLPSLHDRESFSVTPRDTKDPPLLAARPKSVALHAGRARSRCISHAQGNSETRDKLMN